MNLAALAAAFVTLSQQPALPAAPVASPTVAPTLAPLRTSPLAEILNAPEARDAMARVAWAEAGNQGESGLAGVVDVIINRLVDGRWGGSVEAVVDAPHQFEPVMRAGGTWRLLRPVSAVQEATVHTIVELALQGHLPDVTNGARYFQNERIVAARASAGLVPASLVGFGGAEPSAQIGAHTFYAGPARSAGVGVVAVRRRRRTSSAHARSTTGGIFFGDNRSESASADPMAAPAAQ